MMEKKLKEKKEEAEEKAVEIKKATLEKKKKAEEKGAELMEAAAQIKEEKEEEARRSGKQAEKVINDFLSSLRSRHEDFSKAWSDYITSEKPLADVIETESEIIIKTDLPGIKKGDVDVSITEDSVEIMAHFKEEYSEEEVDYVMRERSYGETKRFIKLPGKVKIKEATAKLENSILTIKLPKLEKSKFKVDID